ncbi:MAG: esterase [Acidobacteriota bacterium]|jgi:enterochelin esterase-like enzyme|nr:esterase [Acidobacteriota bacterium]
MLLSHGWGDGLIPALSTIDFYQLLTENLKDEKLKDSVLSAEQDKGGFEMLRKLFVSAFILGLFAALPAEARTDRIKVRGASLEGNLEGNSPERDVLVVLPPNYDSNPDKRYPVIYFLHGFFATLTAYDELVKFQDAVDEAAKAGNEVIVVVPDANTKWKGAMYGASVTTGDFPLFIAQDLVKHIDSNYRTLARPESRGLSGHSMGGFGTLKIAMLYPGTFSSIFAMAPCCLSPNNYTVEQVQSALAMNSEQIASGGFGQLAAGASMAAWAPDPNNPPHYIMNGVKDGAIDPLFNARMRANSPLVMFPQYLPSMRALKAIQLEVGDKDSLIRDDTWMHEELNKFGIRHEWKVFDGDHGNRVAPRFRSELLPFFGRHLAR